VAGAFGGAGSVGAAEAGGTLAGGRGANFAATLAAIDVGSRDGPGASFGGVQVGAAGLGARGASICASGSAGAGVGCLEGDEAGVVNSRIGVGACGLRCATGIQFSPRLTIDAPRTRGRQVSARFHSRGDRRTLVR
jgi:hypothetical protein